MTDMQSRQAQVIHWDKYQDYELSTADGALMGFVSGVTAPSEGNEKYLSIRGTAEHGEELQVPVSAIGIISEFSLVLDVNADAIEFIDIGGHESNESETGNGRTGSNREGLNHLDIPPGDQRLRTGRDGSAGHELGPPLLYGVPRAKNVTREGPTRAEARSQLAIQRSLEPRIDVSAPDRDAEGSQNEMTPYRNRTPRRRSGNGDGRLEVTVTHARQTEESYEELALHGLHRRTFVLEQLVLDMYMRQNGFDESSIDAGVLRMPDTNPPAQSPGRDDIESLSEEYNQLAERSLADLDVVYLFAGSVYESLRHEAGLPHDFLATWAICADGNQVLVHLTSGDRERREDWKAHFHSLIDRGLDSPVTVTTNGTPGLIRAAKESFPEARRVRCWTDKMNAVLDESPATIRPGLKLWLQSIRDAPDYAHGEDLMLSIREKFEANYPDAMRVLADDLQESLVHLSLPVTHRRAVRDATLTEQNALDEWDRSTVLSNLRDQQDGLAVVFGILWRSSRWWQRLRFTWAEREQLETL